MSDGSLEQRLRMAAMLRDRRRFDESAAMIHEVIAEDPKLALSYFELALTQLHMEGKKREALESVESAIALDPEESLFHTLRSSILSGLGKTSQAHEAADLAINLDPDFPGARVAKASAYMEEKHWAEAEDCLLDALALDADHESAGNLLAHVQRMQNRMDDTRQTVEQLLSENPESAYAHYNAGWAALQKHDPRKAEHHFCEALRLDADFDPAREGLLEAFKARSGFYRAYLKYCFFMQQFTSRARWFIIIGLLVGVQVGSRLLRQVHPLAASILIFAYLLLALWGWLASGVGNLFILADRTARNVLTKEERWKGIFVGGGLILGLALMIGGFAVELSGIAAVGAFLALGALPASLFFTNENRHGRRVFGGFLIVDYLCLLVALFLALTSGGMANGQVWNLVTLNVILNILCTWIGNTDALRVSRE